MMLALNNGNGRWIEPTDPNTIEEIVESVVKADVIISDIDGTVAPNNKIGILYSEIARRKLAGHSLRWFDKGVGFSKFWYTKEYAKGKAFPGVLDFYQDLSKLNPDQKKIMVSRNARIVLNAYQQALCFTDILPREFDKKEAVDKIIDMYPNARNFVVFGNDSSDQEMLDHLRAKKDERYSVKGIYVASSRPAINKGFDANIGRHYGALRDKLPI